MTFDIRDHEETRYTDDVTGGQKGGKLTQVGALDPVALVELARVAGYGAAKYAPFNYLKGYDWALSFNAMQRHALLFWSGEDIDEESGRMHMAMAAWHALTLVSFLARGVGTDTRPPNIRDPNCCELACYEDPECTCDGCREEDALIAHQLPTTEYWGIGDGFITDRSAKTTPDCPHTETYTSLAGTINCSKCFRVLLDEHGCPWNGVVGKPPEHDPELVHKR